MFEPAPYRKLLNAKEVVANIDHPAKRFHAKLELDAAIHIYNISKRWWHRRIKYIGED